MYPIICQIGPFTVYSYGLMLVLAVVVSSSLAASRAKKKGINPEIIYNLSFIAVVFGILGARIFYVAENISYYSKNPVEMILLQRGGLSWFGGLALGSIAVITYLKKKKMPLYKTLDLIIPFVALAQTIGRIGCLLNGCCFGRPSGFGIYFPAQGRILIPIQIYSSLTLALIFLFLNYLQNKPHKEGVIFFTYLLLYSLKRFIIEFWRVDNPVILWRLTLFQFISIAVFCLSFFMLLSLLKSRK